MNTRTYSASWGVRIWLVTAVVQLLFLTLLGVMALVLPERLRVLGLFLLIDLVAAAFWIRGYELTGDELHVLRPGWRSRLPLAGLRESVVDSEALRGAWKTIGNDGLFAIHGWFWSKRFGKFRAFATNPANAVVLQFDERVVVVSPDNPAAFVREVNRRLAARGEGRR